MTPFMRVTQILEDIFDIPTSMIDEEDDLLDDWGFTDKEMRLFRDEFCTEFNLSDVPSDIVVIKDFLELTC